MNTNGKFRILALDGGGIRGIITIGLLQRLKAESGVDLIKNVDLIAGTSTGGLIALGLAAGLPLTDIEKLYRERGEAIFSSMWPRYLRYVKNFFTARYDNRELAQAIADQLGEATKLGDLQRKVLICAFDLEGRKKFTEGIEKVPHWKAKFFHNLEGEDNGPTKSESDWHMLARDAALFTASAPVYFPTAKGFVDGGVVASNPCMAALAQTQDVRYFDRSSRDPLDPTHQPSRPRSDHQKPLAPHIPDDIVMLSLGTGENQHRISKAQKLTWGYLSWIWPLGKSGAPLLSLMLDGDAKVASYQCEQLLGKNFCRLQVIFGDQDIIDMDQADKDNIRKMDDYVEECTGKPEFKETVNWICTKW